MTKYNNIIEDADASNVNSKILKNSNFGLDWDSKFLVLLTQLLPQL